MAENVGAIYYTVEADTQKLIDSVKPADSSLDSLNKTFARTDKAANQSQFQLTKTAQAVKSLGDESQKSLNPMGSLNKLLAQYISFRGVVGLVQMAEAYGEMAERVQMATTSAAEYETVQTRLLATANKTYRSLAEAQESYIRTSASLRSLGYDTDSALDITDSLSYSFVKNAASTDRAARATDAFSKALNKGKVEADGWETLIAAVPTIIDDIASAAGKTSAEIRQMGVSGQVTATMLTEGLRKSLDENKKAADGMATTVKDAFTALTNNLSALVGEANRSSSATGLLSAAVLGLANNLESLVNVLLVVGAGMTAKYIAGLAASVVASARAALAAKANAVAALEVATANAAATAAAAGHAAAQVRLGGSLAASTAAATANRAAQAALATAQGAVAASSTSLMALLGGPLGIIGLLGAAAAAAALFGSSSKTAAPQIDELAKSVDNLTQAQLDLRKVQVSDRIEQLEKDARAASKTVQGITRDIEALTEARRKGRNITGEELANANKSLVEEKAALEDINAELQKGYDLQEKLNSQKPRTSGGVSPKPQADPEVAKRLQALRDEAALAKLTGEARAKLQAIQKLGANATKEEQAEAQRLAAEIYKLEQAQKGTKDATKESAQASKENKKVIDELASSLIELGLKGEALAVAKAKSSLNKFATPQDIADVEALARAIYQVHEAQANKQLLGQVDPIAGEQMSFQTQIENLRKLNEAKLLEDQRYLDLKAQAETAHDERMSKLQEENFRRQSSWNDLLIGSLDRMGQAATDSLVGLVTGASSGTDAIRALAGAIIQDAVGSLVQMGVQYVKNLIIGKAAGTAAAAVGVAQAGVLAAAWAPAAALASLATLGANSAPATAGIASTMAVTQGMALTGVAGRQYGGPVDASKMYRVNENGAPEILNTASGRQYLLPNSRGQVVSNDDATASGKQSGGLIVNLVESRDRAGQVEQSQGLSQEDVLTIFVADIRGGGRAAQAIEGTYGVRRRGS